MGEMSELFLGFSASDMFRRDLNAALRGKPFVSSAVNGEEAEEYSTMPLMPSVHDLYEPTETPVLNRFAVPTQKSKNGLKGAKTMARTYNNKETDVKMVPRNDHGEYVKVCRLTPEGKGLSSVDIRNYYTSENDGNIYPTQKGVRIHSEMLVDTVAAILDALTDDEFIEALDKTKHRDERG